MLFKTPNKTAEELGISDAEVEALMWVRDRLREGKLVHHKVAEDAAERFNMGEPCSGDYCGTIACIGGWVWIHMRLSGRLPNFLERRSAACYVGDHSDNSDGSLHKLYYPDTPPTHDYETITTEQAADAIDNYLLTGNPDWMQVLGLAK